MSQPRTASPSSHAVDVSILVVSFNTYSMTLEALESVTRETGTAKYELIVVDNASSDGSASAIATWVPGAHLLALQENIGFGRATNLAARHAQGEFLLLLNPDTIVTDRAIDRLLAFARANPQAMIWGGRTLFADGRLNPSSCWGRMTPWNLFCRASGLTGLLPRTEMFNGEAFGGWPRDSVREVDIVSGCFLLIPRALWQRLGGFDPLFFMYGEEADLCLRARAFGARPMVTPTATIIHHGGASEATRSAKMVKLLAAKASLVERHFSPVTRSLGLTLLAAWPATRALALSFLSLVTRSPRHAESAATWREIWARRREWRHGYTPPAPRSAPLAGQPFRA